MIIDLDAEWITKEEFILLCIKMKFRLFPRVLFARLYRGQDELLGVYTNQTIILNPFRSDVTFLLFFRAWIHEYIHHLLRYAPKINEAFDKFHNHLSPAKGLTWRIERVKR